MRTREDYEQLFQKYGGFMRTAELSRERVYYHNIQKLLQEQHIEKIRPGFYRWNSSDDFSEANLIAHLFPDGILCMDTALRYYGYSDRTPGEWHIAVDKDTPKSRFKLDYPFVKPYYLEPSILNLGLAGGTMDGHPVRVYNKDRTICDCLRYRNKMDKEVFNKGVQAYINDPGKSIPQLLAYAEALRVKKVAKDLIGVWL